MNTVLQALLRFHFRGDVNVLAKDTFTAADGSISGRTLEAGGGTWTVDAGTFAISSHQVTQSANADGFAHTDAGLAGTTALPVTAKLDVLIPGVTLGSASWAAGVVGRLSDTGHNYLGFIEIDSGGSLRVQLNATGNGGSAGNKTIAVTPNRTYTLYLTCAANVVSLRFTDDAGLKYLTTTNAANNTATLFGMNLYKDATYSQMYADNFQVSTPGPVAGVLSVTGHDSSSVTLSVTAAYAGARPYSYQLQRSPDSATWVTTGCTLRPGMADATATTLASTGLAASTTYYYRVKVTGANTLSDGTGVIAYSNVVSQATDAAASAKTGLLLMGVG